MTLNSWWTSWSEFAAMGGYGLYVWGSFGVCTLVVSAELTALRSRRAALRRHGGHPDERDDDASNPESPPT